MGEAGKSSAHRFRDAGEPPGEAAHMQFVDDRVAPRDFGPARWRRVWRAGFRLRGMGAAVVRRGREQGRVQARRVAQFQRERIDQQFLRIEPQAALRREGAVGAQAVERAGLQAGDKTVEDRAGASRQAQAGDFMRAGGVEQAEVDALGCLRKHRDIGAAGDEPQTQRLRRARQDIHGAGARAR